MVIATKFNAVFDETTRQVTGSDTSPAGIRAACEDSLRRLNTDYIDLYQFHDNGYPPEKAEPVRETLEELVKAGKIRAYGWSTDFPDRLEVFARGPGAPPSSCSSMFWTTTRPSWPCAKNMTWQLSTAVHWRWDC